MPSERTIAACRHQTIVRLKSGGVVSAESEADWFLSELLGIDRPELHLRVRDAFPSSLKGRLEGWLQDRIQGRPLQYILGETEFFSLPFAVTSDVLIPRPETELLVEQILHRIGPSDARSGPILDIGTGSGAIAVTLAHSLPRIRVVATDISLSAIHIAQQNAARNGVSDRIAFLCADALCSLRGAQGFSAIVSNPPYIPTQDLAQLPRDVRLYEPCRALDGGSDGLSTIRRIVSEAAPHLQEAGLLALEVDSRNAEASKDLVEAQGAYEGISIQPDMAGRPRMILARKILVE